MTTFFACVALWFTSTLYAAEQMHSSSTRGGAAGVQNRGIEESKGSRFYFGLDLFSYQLRTQVQDIKVQSQRFFSGSRMGYEYLKPKAVYFGIETLSASTDAQTNWRVTSFLGVGMISTTLNATIRKVSKRLFSIELRAPIPPIASTLYLISVSR